MTDPEQPTTLAHAKAVEAKIAQLRKANRLAMHQWENMPPYQFPEKLDAVLSEPMPQAPLHFQGAFQTLLSCSLVPSRYAMVPYMVKPASVPTAGYLFDLTQTDKNSPRVLRVYPENLNSGHNTRNKSLKLSSESKISALEALYKQFGTEAHVRKAMNGPDAATLSDTQLDLMGEYLSGDDLPPNHFAGPKLLDHNEIIAALTHDDLAAIYVPVYEYMPTRAQFREPYYRMQAAIAGLQHEDEGIDLPVMLYNVMKPGQGSFTYVAQGREELLHVLQQSLQQLANRGALQQAKPDEWPTQNACAAIRKLGLGEMLDRCIAASANPTPQSQVQQVTREARVRQQAKGEGLDSI